MAQDTQIVLPFARLCGKNLQADFDGATLSSDGGVLFLLPRLVVAVALMEAFGYAELTLTARELGTGVIIERGSQ